MKAILLSQASDGRLAQTRIKNSKTTRRTTLEQTAVERELNLPWHKEPEVENDKPGRLVTAAEKEN